MRGGKRKRVASSVFRRCELFINSEVEFFLFLLLNLDTSTLCLSLSRKTSILLSSRDSFFSVL